MGKEGVEVGAAVGLFELCNPHLLATDTLQSLLAVLKPRPPPTERGEMLELVRSQLSPKEQRKRNRQGHLKPSGKRGGDLDRRDGDLPEPSSDGAVKDLSMDEQKSAEEKLKERLKAKFSVTGGDQHDSEAKRAKISWP